MDLPLVSGYVKEQRSREAIERELDIARRIQASFLPGSLPQPEGWEIASRFEAAREVAGDFYDAFTLAGGRRTGLVIGDVCDKGVGAALFMALFRSLIRAFADQHFSLGWMDVLTGNALGSEASSHVTHETHQSASVHRRRELLSPGTTALKKAVVLTNDYIARNHGQANMFATLFFGVLDPLTGALTYINGGHEPPMLVGQSGIKARLAPTGPAVGLFPGVEFGIEQIELEAGDTLLVFTDGVLDARNSADQPFGELKLERLIQQPAASAEFCLENLLQALHDHMAGAEQFDDITLLALRRNPPPGQESL
jgi:sigma-B regulation protein RsbU (phosphoserine phosphatase)